ncbi:MAG: hypothetical protein JST54_12470 [Deltaproteobacteria bacterium]|nr:hypothetical protein [Deltaproteobacteria bacterium]
MRAAALVVAALVLVASQARAQGIGMGLGSSLGEDPCAPGAYDPDAGPVLTFTSDGGPAEPVVICQGQRAPAHGTFTTKDATAMLAGQLAGTKQEVKDLKAALANTPTIVTAPSGKVAIGIGVALFVLGAAAGGVAVYELKK